MSRDDLLRMDGDVAIALIGMAAMTLGCRVGGYWLFTRMKPSRILRDGLSYVPASMLMALIAPALANGGVAHAVGAAATVAAMVMSRNFGIAAVAGLGACWAVWEL